MNIQEAFNIIWERSKIMEKSVKATNHPAFSYKGCAYRGADGTACFIGCLFPDELYDPRFDIEGAPIKAIIDESPGIKALLSPIPLSFLEQVQKIHDNFPPGMWHGQLVKLAKEYDLEVPE